MPRAAETELSSGTFSKPFSLSSPIASGAAFNFDSAAASDMKAAVERAKKTRDLATLQSVIAKAEKEQLSIIAEARAQIPVVAQDELTAAKESAKELKNLSILQSAIAKAEIERLVDTSIIAEAKALIPGVELMEAMKIAKEMKNPLFSSPLSPRLRRSSSYQTATLLSSLKPRRCYGIWRMRS